MNGTGPRRATGSGARFAALALAMLAAGCAKKGVPSGGPPDLVPPRLVATAPDSGASRVARGGALALTFSEGMEPRSTSDAVSLAPTAAVKQRRWSGRTLTLVLADSLRARQTYTLFVGGGARDRHGVPMGTGKAVTFTTGETFPPGRISGRIEAKGFPVAGAYVWCYADGREPDSTAQDFDALGLARESGEFEVLGLAVPGRYRLWTFGDLNQNRSFEPDKDVLVRADSLVSLAPDAPSAEELRLLVRNPRAPSIASGTVRDSLGDSTGVLRVLAVSEQDSTRRVLAEAGAEREFQLALGAGTWRLVAFRDLDKNKQWNAAVEPASDPLRLEVLPAEEIKDLELVLRPPRVVGSGP